MKNLILGAVVLFLCGAFAFGGYRYHQVEIRKSRPGTLTIVAAGSSTTAGYFEPGTLDQLSAYPEHLRRLLIDANPALIVNMINAGVGGDTAPKLLARLNRDVLKHSPDIVIVMIGLNDAMKDDPTFEQTLDRIVARLQAGGTRVVLATPGYLAKTPDRAIGPWAETAARFNQRQNDGVVADRARAVRNVARARNVPLADIYAMWEAWERDGRDTDALLANGLNHPLPEVHEAMAKIVFDAMQSVLP